jgi:peptide chain release factor 3
MSTIDNEVKKRRTFAIISHPDAGKTTVTEKLLLLGGAIQVAGTVKARKSTRHATSDWMEIEKQRGISVTSSVMQFDYKGHIINLLDTPGHEDFSEDTYRTLSAVDSALMIIDAARGVEARTIKLLEVCRLRKTPVITFVNKLDRNGREPLDLLDEIESILDIKCCPITWPLGSGPHLEGIYDFRKRLILPYEKDQQPALDLSNWVNLDLAHDDNRFQEGILKLEDEIGLLEGAGNKFTDEAYLSGEITPVFFGTALRTFGLAEMLDMFIEIAPSPLPRPTNTIQTIAPTDDKFSGFVFKIQANMDPKHRDRIAFMRVCSGQYQDGQKSLNVRLGREVKLSGAVQFMARSRDATGSAWPGDIIGIHNHGTIQIGDTFTEGENYMFSGIPSFAPDLFRRVRSADPLRNKALLKGLTQLCEEGAVQVFNYKNRSEIVVGAIGQLQFEVVAWRLENEYSVECLFEGAQVQSARWVVSDDKNELSKLELHSPSNIAVDGAGQLVYLAPSMANLKVTEDRCPSVSFRSTREMLGS